MKKATSLANGTILLRKSI